MTQKQRDYDHDKLTVHFERKIPISEFTSLVGRVYSYENSERRVKILSEIRRKDNSLRMLKQFPPLKKTEQVEALLTLLSECQDHLI